LCTNHHRTHYGIHTLPHALWETMRFRKNGTLPAAEVVANPNKMKSRKINDIISTNKEKQGEINGNNTPSSSS